MSKISIDRLLEKGEIYKRKLEAEKLAAERIVTGNTLTDRVNVDNNSSALIPYFVNHSKFENAYLQAITEEKLLELFPSIDLNGKNIQYKGHDWTRKLSIKNELVVGDLVGIPAHLDGRDFDGRRVLEELVNFGSIFKEKELIEIEPYSSNFERSRETDAISKSISYHGHSFNIYTVLTDCGYLASEAKREHGPYKFKIIGMSRNKAPSLTLFAKLLEGQKEARQKTLDMQTLTIYHSDFSIKECKPVHRTYDVEITFEDIKSHFGDSLSTVLVLDNNDNHFGNYFTKGVRLTN